ncbi:hypothetical protein AbraIFM66950_007049 [Aspergillus brasiliensis]|nr:hypothetical protein AbraIFM66950_007049 [Aspergillus brasiliensis]
MPSQADDKRQAAREVIDILHEISTLLAVIKDLRKEAGASRGFATEQQQQQALPE